MQYFRFFMFLILLLLSGNAFAAGGKYSVAFMNNSEKLLSCVNDNRKLTTLNLRKRRDVG
jgi:hypothetical protein